jgi:hypothetical protein
MKSVDYLYELLKPHPEEGWYIGRKRYTLGTSKKKGGSWEYAVCFCWRDRLGILGEFYPDSETAWEAFLSANYPAIMQKWRDRENETNA